MPLSKAACKYCGNMITGTDTDQTYHIYKEHGEEKVIESYYKGYDQYAPEICKILFTKEQGLQIILNRMKQIDEELETLK